VDGQAQGVVSILPEPPCASCLLQPFSVCQCGIAFCLLGIPDRSLSSALMPSILRSQVMYNTLSIRSAGVEWTGGLRAAKNNVDQFCGERFGDRGDRERAKSVHDPTRLQQSVMERLQPTIVERLKRRVQWHTGHQEFAVDGYACAFLGAGRDGSPLPLPGSSISVHIEPPAVRCHALKCPSVCTIPACRFGDGHGGPSGTKILEQLGAQLVSPASPFPTIHSRDWHWPPVRALDKFQAVSDGVFFPGGGGPVAAPHLHVRPGCAAFLCLYLHFHTALCRTIATKCAINRMPTSRIIIIFHGRGGGGGLASPVQVTRNLVNVTSMRAPPWQSVRQPRMLR
jgi:hypothetical protein